MKRCRGVPARSALSLSSYLSSKYYEFNNEHIDEDSILEIKNRTLEYLTNICRVSRILEPLIQTINVIVEPKLNEETNIEVIVEAAEEVLQLFKELRMR